MRTGVILVGHGSREPYNKEAIEYFASILGSRYDFVSAAFMRINKPTLKEKLQEAIEVGVDKNNNPAGISDKRYPHKS